MQTISLSLSDEDVKIIRQVAERTGIRSTSATVRHILYQWLQKCAEPSLALALASKDASVTTN